MGKKLTFEDIKQYFEDKNCELLEKEYKDTKTKMKYKCSCGNISEIKYSHFKDGHRCRNCGNIKTTNKKKLKFKEVKQFFEKQGCELLEKEYKNNKTKMKYICKCGNISTIRYDNFKQGQKCRKCSGTEKHTFKEVKQFFEKQECELLETTYINCDTKMRYKCSCGNISKISFSVFKRGARCNKCGYIKRAQSHKLSYKYVYNYFKDQTCELLETEYKGCEVKMRYKCSCGNISYVHFGNFKLGKRCKQCGINKNSGENHWNYNPNLTNEERQQNKSRMSDLYYQRWRKNILTKNHYICQKCLKNKRKLRAHHIFSWANNPDLRFNKSNGITLCEDCHKQFHQLYGKTNNNKQQLDDYLETG